MSIPTPILQYNLSDATMKGLLPDGYTPLAYIESTTAGEHIDTGFVYSSGNITIDCEYTVPSNNSTIFGSSNDNTKWLCLIYKKGSNSYHYCGTINGSWANSELSGNKRKITYSISGTTCTLNDGKQSVSASCGTIPAQTYSYTLWCHHHSNTFVQHAKNARIYYFRLIYQGNLTLDYRPARRDSDGVIGMYDLVSRTFKTNSGSGAFIAGPELAVGKGGGKSLPEEYQQVEWIESIGSQYINTGYNPNNNTRVLTEFMPIGNKNRSGFFGSYQNADFTTNTFGLYYSSTTTLAYSNFCSDSSFTRDTYLIHDVKHLVDKNKNILTIDGTTVIAHTNTTFQSTAPLYIFALNKDEDRRYSNTRMWYFKIYDDETIVRNFIPCYRKSDMKPGMYDTVDGVFYTNAGSDEFILGPSITNCYTSEPNAGSGTQQGLYTNLSGIYDSSKGWVAGFNGNTSKLISQGNSSFVLPLSISCWINFAAMNSTYQYAISYNRNDGGTSYHLFGIGAHSSKLAFWSCGAAEQINDSISTNTWYHVTLTINSSKQATFYLNGVQKYQGTPGDSSITATDFWIGCRCAGQYWFNGMLSNVQVWDSVLTEAQVKELYGK